MCAGHAGCRRRPTRPVSVHQRAHRADTSRRRSHRSLAGVTETWGSRFLSARDGTSGSIDDGSSGPKCRGVDGSRRIPVADLAWLCRGRTEPVDVVDSVPESGAEQSDLCAPPDHALSIVRRLPGLGGRHVADGGARGMPVRMTDNRERLRREVASRPRTCLAEVGVRTDVVAAREPAASQSREGQ